MSAEPWVKRIGRRIRELPLVCATHGPAPHNSIPLGDHIFHHHVRVGECRPESSKHLSGAREARRGAGWSTMPEIVRGAKLLHAGEVLLVPRLNLTMAPWPCTRGGPDAVPVALVTVMRPTRTASRATT